MKKNMVYLATGIVFFIFAVCIAYVFTEPTKSQEQQEAALQEQDASRLNTQDTEKAMPSADSLVFNAQNNTAQITTPPAEENTEEENIQKNLKLYFLNKLSFIYTQTYFFIIVNKDIFDS